MIPSMDSRDLARRQVAGGEQPKDERGFAWVEGRGVIIDRRAANGLADRASEIASEFVRLKVDLILTSGDAQGLAAKRATTVIPIVSSGDKTATGEMIVSVRIRC